VAPLVLEGPAPVIGLGHLLTELERTWQPLPIPTHSIASLPLPLYKTSPLPVDKAGAPRYSKRAGRGQAHFNS
jgi:hypothetical protein